MAISTRPQVLALYKSLLREARKFTEYNYRMYALRKTRDSFRTNKYVTDPQQIWNLLKDAQQNLTIIQRQVVVGQLYGEGRLIIEGGRSNSPPG
ncbi:LYR motif-containing protein 4-like [Haliotis rufescens]|uniref:LYR motif-containing protein 4-like n=1 Tax=Haliotis rufescens TaxID=6454 RepID=UPI001EB00C47|nr:LYR motif-containing protein 4-like [Haliotis rufescens]